MFGKKRKKTILITGATGLLGTNIIRAFADTHNFIGVARKKPTNPHPNVVYLEADIATDGQSILKKIDPYTIDVVIHCAAYLEIKKFEDRDRDSFEKAFTTNISGPLDFNNTLIKHWKKTDKKQNIKKGKSFIFISSTAASSFFAVPGWGLYSGLKSTINFIAKQTNLECEEYGIKSYAVAPYYLSDLDTMRTTVEEIGNCIDDTVQSGQIRAVYGTRLQVN